MGSIRRMDVRTPPSGVPWPSSATATVVLEAAFPALNAPANFAAPLPFSPSQPPLVPIPLPHFLSLETRFYSPGLDILLACCSVDFFVFVRNGPSFTTSLVYPLRRGTNSVEMVYMGVKERT